MLSFGYQYLVGGLVFAFGLLLVWRGGELGLRGRGGRAFFGLVAGLALLALLQGIFQWLATH